MVNIALRLWILILLITSGASSSHAADDVPALRFTGIVISAPPAASAGTAAAGAVFHVKSLRGEVNSFYTPASPPRLGAMIDVRYRLDERNRLVVIAPVDIIGATVSGTVEQIAQDRSFVVVRTRNPDYPASDVTLSLQTSIPFHPLVASMHPGDGVNGSYSASSADSNILTIQSLEWQSKSVGRGARWLALGGGALFLYLLAWALCAKPAELILGEDNRYSTSKFQTVMWFWLVISAYIAIVAHRFFASDWNYIGGVDIPLNLLALSGLNIVTFTAAKVITLAKIDQAHEKGIEAKPRAERPRVADLIRNDDDKVDLGDYQMLVVTLLAIVVYAVGVVEFMERIEFRRVVTMPDVDATLLAIFGLGQLAYLGKKAAGDSTASAQKPGTAAGMQA